jgi:hypothetical protein
MTLFSTALLTTISSLGPETKERTPLVFITILARVSLRVYNGCTPASLWPCHGVGFVFLFHVYSSYSLKSIIFWDITTCSPLSVNRRFGGTHRLHLQDRRNNFGKKPASKQVALACWLVSCRNYFFDPEDGGDMFLRNVG